MIKLKLILKCDCGTTDAEYGSPLDVPFKPDECRVCHKTYEIVEQEDA